MLGGSEPSLGRTVRNAERVGMIETADGCDVSAMFLQRRKNARELVVRPRFRDFKVIGIHPIGQIDEDAAAGATSTSTLGRAQRVHAIKQRQGQRRSDTTEEMTPTKQPVLGEKLSHRKDMVGPS